MDRQKLDDLLSKYEKGTCTKDELTLLYRFFDSFQDDSIIWNNKITSKKEQVQRELSVRINAKIDLKERNKKRQTIQILWKVAAGILLLIGLSIIFKENIFQKDEPLRYERFVSNDNGIKEITLFDGSKVWLNRKSELYVPGNYGTSGFREVTLQGEAFFEVAKDENRPFIVNSDGVQTKVLGTEFNVRKSLEGIEVSLFKGSVEIKESSNKVLLKPQEKAVCNWGENKIRVIGMDEELELAWMSNNFDFDRTELSRVSSLLERRFHKSIMFEKPELADKKVTGHFEDENLHTILLSVARAGNMDFKFIDKEHILIFEPPKNNGMKK